ncbi:MAG TPA: tetratricopeptide repeat protein [Chthoniobacteraceae bacterium]|jgi:tetratricopeptide (TPR) repeat protein|nr:tetratricopeptide repeat protein [Chthoniobacteraceae bacterium]
MPIQTEKDLSGNARALWLKALSAVELRNYGYSISLIQAVLKEFPAFLDARRMLRKAEVASNKGKKSFLSGLSSASLKGASVVKKDPVAAMELAEKNLEADPYSPQANNLLKDAAKAAGYPEIAAFALETIIEGNPKDTKVMHELGEFYIGMGDPDKAVKIYTRITEVNPSDLVAVKRSKDASATASMKSGGWDKKDVSYRDLIKDKDQAESLEQKSRVVKDVEMIDQQLHELYPQWDQAQDNVDLSRRLAKLYEDRFEQTSDDESLEAAIYYYKHTNSLVSGTDPAVARRLSDLELKRRDARINALEKFFAEGGHEHEDSATYQVELENLRKERTAAMLVEARKRVERNPTDLQLRFELGELLLAMGQFNDAIPELQRARQNPNSRLKAMSLLGRCFVQKGMLDMAATQFKSAASEMMAMDTVKKDTVYDLGLVYEQMGRKDEYLQCMKDIMEADYGYKDVAKRVEASYGQS